MNYSLFITNIYSKILYLYLFVQTRNSKCLIIYELLLFSSYALYKQYTIQYTNINEKDLRLMYYKKKYIYIFYM